MIRSVKIGLIGGSVVIYLAMTGILERFDQRPVITGVIGLGRTLILAAFFITGYLAARGVRRTSRPKATDLMCRWCRRAGGGCACAVCLVVVAHPACSTPG